jgi:acetyl esterase/lipase
MRAVKRSWLVVVAACGGAPVVPVAPSEADVDARAAAMVDAFANSQPMLAGDRVVFVSTRDGLPQLYVGERAHPDAPPRRLLALTERMYAPRLAADGSVLFVSDVGSDENFHIFKVGIDGNGLVDLTPNNDLRRSPPIVTRTGTLVYTGHTHTDQSTHVVVQAIDGEPRDVYVDKSVGGITDVTTDGTRALYTRYISDTDQRLFVIELGSGALRQVYPREGGSPVAIGDAVFAPDGASIYASSAVAKQPATVLRIDAASGAELARFTETTMGEVVNLRLAGNCVVVDVDAGDHTELRVLGLDLRPQTQPKLPLAAISVGLPVGTQVPLALSTAAGPTDIAVLDAVSGAITPLRDEPRRGLGTPPHATIETLTAFDGRKLPLNLYLPDRATRRRPVLVLVHGGPTGNAKIAWSPIIGFWTAMGFVVVAPNIRGSSGFGIDYEQADDREKRVDAAHDIETINQWARKQPWCDGDRIVIGGISYGGYMTLLALTRQPRLWAAGIDGSGMSNLKTMEELEDQTIRAADDTEFGLLGKDDALLAEWSPITAVDKIVAPVFVYQGVRDPVTPQHEADQIVEALRKRNVPVEYMLIANEGHGVTRRENFVAYLARSYRFVTSHMK